ncbi:hypothetical protein JL722_2272 [Aureococcus anophagefferens]|nr:hypothetical protein JL722_2272 [Aureococcus anophagefferens]
MRSSLRLLLAACVARCGADELELGGAIESHPVEGTVRLRGAGASLPTTEVVLNGGEYRTYTRPDGGFVFHDVEPGVYLLDVLSVDYIFSQQYEVRERRASTLFRNPMMLMLLFTGAVVVLMPKMMDNMDPEEMKKMQEQMGAAQDPASMLKNLCGGGGGDDDDDDDEPPQKKLGARK